MSSLFIRAMKFLKQEDLPKIVFNELPAHVCRQFLVFVIKLIFILNVCLRLNRYT